MTIMLEIVVGKNKKMEVIQQLMVGQILNIHLKEHILH